MIEVLALMAMIIIIVLVDKTHNSTADEPVAVPQLQTNLGPLVLDENFEVYFNTMTRSTSSCFEVVRSTEPASSAVDCVTGVVSPKDMEIESREMIGDYHERIVILLNALSGFRCTIVIPKNPGPEDIPSIGC